MDSETVLSGEENENLMKHNVELQKLEEKAKKAEDALAAEEKVRKELEGLNAKLLAEKTALLESLSGEKGALQEYQEKTAKLQAQKNDLDNQLRVSWKIIFFFYFKKQIQRKIDVENEFDFQIFFPSFCSAFLFIYLFFSIISMENVQEFSIESGKIGFFFIQFIKGINFQRINV